LEEEISDEFTPKSKANTIEMLNFGGGGVVGGG